MPEVVHELIATERAFDKLAARNIDPDETAQLPRNPDVTVRIPAVRGGDGF